MNLNNFESNIDKKILDRGYNYYIEGNIMDTSTSGDNEYIFEIEGSEDYQVVVKIDNKGEILYSECDCPYDFGDICKHEVAAYYELHEIYSKGLDNEKEEIKRPEIKEVLRNLSKDQLINIILDITNKDSALKNSIIFRYSEGDDKQELEKCKRLLESVVRKFTKGRDFISYRETYGFVSELQDLLEKANQIYQISNKPLLALDITFMLLEEAIESFQYSDDSNGEIGDFISEIIWSIEEVVIGSKNLDIETKEKILNKLLSQVDSGVFNGWEDYKNDLIGICGEFSDNEKFREKLTMKIKSLVEENGDDQYKKYSSEGMLLTLLNSIEESGKKEEAEEFIKENLKYQSFREIYIDKCMKEKNYYKALELAQEGEVKDKDFAGLVLRWKKLKYDAYKKLSLIEEQEKLAKELLLDGSFEYYKELKELHKKEEKTFYSTIKEELKKIKGWRGESTYLQLIVEEKDLDEIMEYVRLNPRTIEDYATMLLDKYKDDVIEVYKKYIKHQASISSNRSNYKNVCRILKQYKKIAGQQNFENIKGELSMLYRNRPAFLDELSKIK